MRHCIRTLKANNCKTNSSSGSKGIQNNTCLFIVYMCAALYFNLNPSVVEEKLGDALVPSSLDLFQLASYTYRIYDSVF